MVKTELKLKFTQQAKPGMAWRNQQKSAKIMATALVMRQERDQDRPKTMKRPRETKAVFQLRVCLMEVRN